MFHKKINSGFAAEYGNVDPIGHENSPALIDTKVRTHQDIFNVQSRIDKNENRLLTPFEINNSYNLSTNKRIKLNGCIYKSEGVKKFKKLGMSK